MSRYFWILMLAGLMVSSGCERPPAALTPEKIAPPGKVTAEDVRRDAAEAAQTAAEYSKQNKEEFQKKLEVQLNELDAKIATLREKGRDLKDDAKVNWDRKLAALEKKREAARVKLAEVGHSTAEAWKDVRKGAQAAWDELDNAFRDAANEF